MTRTTAILAVLVVLASLLIVLSARDDLWFDEVWSIDFAERADSPIDVFRIHHDNNHILNTIFLQLSGRPGHWIWYRWHSIGFGIASLLLVAAGALGRDPFERALSVVLIGCSFPMLLYFSEARGYGSAVFFAILAWGVLRHFEQRRTWSVRATFWLASCLGLLAHLTFIQVYLACLGWTAISETRRRAPAAAAIELLKMHAVPLGFLAGFYFLHVRHVVIGGGPDFSVARSTGEFLVMAFGIPGTPMGYDAGWAVFLVLLVLGLSALRKHGDREWIFFGLVLVVAPVVTLLIARPPLVYFRYFLVCLPFLYVLAARLSVRLFRAGRGPGIVVAVVLAGVLIGHAARLDAHWTYGRGTYSDTLDYIVEHSRGKPILVGSDHDLRNGFLVRFYARYLPEDAGVVYVEKPAWAAQPPDWIVTHSWEPGFEPDPEMRLQGGQAYGLVATFPHAGVTGCNWYVYERRG